MINYVTQSDDFAADKGDQGRGDNGAGLDEDCDANTSQQPEVLGYLRYVWKILRHDSSPIVIH